jgi:hypothetical protein
MWNHESIVNYYSSVNLLALYCITVSLVISQVSSIEYDIYSISSYGLQV